MAQWESVRKWESKERIEEGRTNVNKIVA